jgi:hypothetical protein
VTLGIHCGVRERLVAEAEAGWSKNLEERRPLLEVPVSDVRIRRCDE